jgi:glycosyltransferase involved in cell wall biosynthesis
MGPTPDRSPISGNNHSLPADHMRPLVSILIPAFNSEEWIADTIRSALNQSWPSKEIIVVDDGSRDKTSSIARRFASKTVRVVSQENLGCCAARNRAFELCQGDYIQWLDADDLLSRDKITKQMEMAERCGSRRTLFSSAWGYFMYRPAKAKFIPTPLWCDLSPAEWLLRKMGQNLHMQTATWLVSRELTEAAGPWNTQLLVNNDGEYFCRVLLKSNGTRFVPDARVFYRILGFDRVSYIGQSERKMESLFLALQLHIKYLRKLEESDRVRAACVRLLQTWLPAFYPERLDIVRQAEQLAESLGGRLEMPRLSWKYAWIQKSVGWPLAKRAMLLSRQSKSSVLRRWDKILSRFDNGDFAAYVGLDNSPDLTGC